MKRVYKVLSICLTLLGLVSSGCMITVNSDSCSMTQLEKNKAIARRDFEQVWNKGNLDTVDEICAADGVGHMPGSPDIHSLEGYKQYVTMYRNAFPDIHFTIEDEIAQGDKVVIRWTSRGTHQGELMGISPTGKQCTVTGITINRFSGGKIQESWNNWDALGMLQQLGVVPPIGEGGKK
jgi:steroid delta-isomerase-like uncharacterized protein